jgi:anaerobic ribonucleoside-triphosphate reductase activating protein
MRYASIIGNDVVNGEDVCVSLFTQGCHRHCKGCFNSSTWDFNGGIEIDENELTEKILSLINKNNIQRNLSILGGEPLCEENREYILRLILKVKEIYPNIKIFIWTGYDIEDIFLNPCIANILQNVDVIIDGAYIEEERDITLKWRGSKNQRILTKEKINDIISIGKTIKGE